MLQVCIYADGASRGNPGPGGYGTIVRIRDQHMHITEQVFSPGFSCTTNNRMELLGVIVGLESLQQPYKLMILSDSSYVVNAFQQHWVESWLAHNWKTAGKKPVKNADLWKRLLQALDGHTAEFRWVKGHNGHEFNERCDELATRAADDTLHHIQDEGFGAL